MFRFVTAGESHGQALIAWISGVPAGVPVDFEFVQRDLHRRQLGYGRGGRQKIEKDRVEFLSGVRHGQTIGAPIAMRIENRDWANWEKALSVEQVPEYEERAAALDCAAPGTCRSGRLDEIQSARRALYSGTRFGPGDGRSRGRREPSPSCCFANSIAKCSAT